MPCQNMAGAKAVFCLDLRAALEAWPRAQSARAALMTLQVSRGELDEGAALAESIQTAPPADQDPWWVYWFGDGRQFTVTRAALRAVLQ